MIARTVLFAGSLAMLAALNSGTLLAQHPHSLAQRIANTDRAKMAHVERRHDGAAAGMDVMTLVDGDQMQSNVLYMFRGEIPPKGGIGHHHHTRVEEMSRADGDGDRDGKRQDRHDGSAVRRTPGERP